MSWKPFARLRLNIPPQPQLRHRVGRGKMYDPSSKYRKLLSMLAKNAFKDEPSSKPIRLTMNFCLTMPKKPKHKIHPIVRPDLDNYQKAVCDSLNGIIYVDDSQVVEIMSRKYYSKPPVEPFIDILAEEFI